MDRSLVVMGPCQQLSDGHIAGDRRASGNNGLEPELAHSNQHDQLAPTYQSVVSRKTTVVRLLDIHFEALDGACLNP